MILPVPGGIDILNSSHLSSSKSPSPEQSVKTVSAEEDKISFQVLYRIQYIEGKLIEIKFSLSKQ